MKDKIIYFSTFVLSLIFTIIVLTKNPHNGYILAFVTGIITFLFYYKTSQKLKDLEDQNKFLHSQYMKIKNENEELKKKLDSRYQVKTFKEDNSDTRYDHVQVKSMKDMYDYHSR